MSVNKKDSAAWVDPDDAPDLSTADLDKAQWKVNDKEVSSEVGQKAMREALGPGRPKAEHSKQPIKLRLDADVLQALRASGKGWQTRVNDMLRASLHLAGRV